MRAFLVTMIFPLTFALSVNAQVASDRAVEKAPASDQFAADKSWDHQIFERELDTLGEFFIKNKNLPDNTKAKFLMKSDVRQSLFRLQALSRMLADQSPKFFSVQRAYFKTLEDAVGKLDLAMSLRKTGDDLNEPKLSARFEKQEKDAQDKLIAALKVAGLWDQPEETIAKLRTDFASKGQWMTGNAEKKALIAIVVSYTEELAQAVQFNRFDEADIEKGLHELRRRLRWIGMQITTLNGVVELQDEAKLNPKVADLIKMAQERNSTMMKSKYMKIDEALVENPILVPRQMLAMITEYVSRIGALKDNAEMQIYIGDAMDGASSTDKNNVDQKLKDLLKSDKVDHQAMSRAIQAQLTETKLLTDFAKQLQEMNK